MSIQNIYSKTEPVYVFDFANSKSLDPRISFQRNSTGTFVDSTGNVATTAANTARIAYDPETGEPEGFIIEPYRENLLTYSENFGSWTTNNCFAVPSGTGSLPDGSSSTSIYYISGVTNPGELRNRSIYQSVSVTSGSFYTFSVYIKKNTNSTYRLLLSFDSSTFGGPTQPYCSLTETNGIPTYTISGNGTETSAQIKQLKNGWYRASFTAKAIGTGTAKFSIHGQATGLTSLDFIESDYIWGAQVEKLRYSTSYGKADGSTKVLNKDNVSINIGDILKSTSGTILVEGEINVNNNTAGRILLSTGTSAGDTAYYISVKANRISTADTGAAITNGNTSDYVNPAAATKSKVAIAYDNQSFSVYVNGTGGASSSVANNIPYLIESLYLGQDPDGSNILGGTIKRIAIWNKKLSNTELQALTTE